eukprot:769548-Prymnesium_polylepis.1
MSARLFRSEIAFRVALAHTTVSKAETAPAIAPRVPPARSARLWAPPSATPARQAATALPRAPPPCVRRTHRASP